jgi:hypothetical protein
MINKTGIHWHNQRMLTGRYWLWRDRLLGLCLGQTHQVVSELGMTSDDSYESKKLFVGGPRTRCSQVVLLTNKWLYLMLWLCAIQRQARFEITKSQVLMLPNTYATEFLPRNETGQKRVTWVILLGNDTVT